MATKAFIKGTLPLIVVTDLVSTMMKKDITKLSRLLKYSVLVLIMSYIEKTKSHFLLSSSFILNFVLNCFSWQFSLYIFIRQFISVMNSNIILSPLFIYVTHLFHNYLLTFQAEKVEPSYLKLWTQTLPYYQKNGIKTWLEEFSSNSNYYSEKQISKERLEKLPQRVIKSFKLQFPFVLLLYTLGLLISIFKTKASGMDTLIMKVKDTGIRICRTSILLAILPYTLCAFPSIYANFMVSNSKKVKRNPFIHVGMTSIMSTLVFLQEPKGRLKMMVGYTIWRVVEALIRDTDKNKNKDDITSSKILSSLFISLSLYFCTKSRKQVPKQL